MNKEQFISSFVTKYQKYIFSSKEDFNQIKEAKKAHIKTYGKKYGLLKDKEIARTAIIFIIKTKNLKSSDDVSKFIESKPYLKKNLPDCSIFEVYLNQPTNELQISSEELKNLQSEEYVKKKTEGYMKKAMTQAKEEIDDIKKKGQEILKKEKEELEKEKKELEKIKSKLDSIRIDDTAFRKNSEILLNSYSASLEVETSDRWWRKLNLIQDPFPTKSGLKRVIQDRFKGSTDDTTEEEKKDFFNTILVKTAIFKEFEGLIYTSPTDLLDKTFIILGEFGSGKSVFFESLFWPSLLNGLMPISIWIDSKRDVEEITFSFYQEIFCSKDLNDKYLELYGRRLDELELEYNKSALCTILKDLINKGQFKGFVFFVDGLHKEEDLYLPSLKFVRNLQNLTDYLIDQDIHTSYLIAGSKIWEKELLQNASLSGSVYQITTMPEITDSEAYDMFNKRFISLSSNPKKPTIIRKDVVSRVYKRLKARTSKTITFRDFIDVILPSLHEGSLEYARINPVYDKQTMEKIFHTLKKDNAQLYSKLLTLKSHFNKKPQNALKLLNLLVGVFDNKCITENTPLFKEKKPLFRLLLEFKLIQKRITNKNEVAWKVDSDIEKFNNEVIKFSGFSFSDVVIDLFKIHVLETSEIKKDEEAKSIEINVLESILISNPKWKKELELRILETGERHKKLLTLKKEPGKFKTIEKGSLIKQVEESLCPLLESIFISSGVGTLSNDFTDLNKLFLESWISKRVKGYQLLHNKRYNLLVTQEGEEDKTQVLDFISVYYRIYPELVLLLEEFIKMDNILHLATGNYTMEDLEILHSIRCHYNKKEYREVVELLSNFYEEKMRKNIYNLLTVKYGDKWKQRLGRIVNDYIKDIKEKDKRSYLRFNENPNALYSADRKHYGLIILDRRGDQNNSTQNWNQIFSTIFTNTKKEQLETYFTEVEVFLTGDAHHYSKEVWEENANRLLFALKHLADILVDINRIYLLTLKEENIFIEKESDITKIYFSSNNKLNDKDHLRPYILSKGGICKKVCHKIEELLQEEHSFLVDFEDSETITYKFSRCQYVDFIATLGVLIKNKFIELDFKNCNYRIKRGPSWGNRPNV